MDISLTERILVSGQKLKRLAEQSVTDAEAFALASRRPREFMVPNGSELRPNMFKAREAALASAFREVRMSHLWVKEVLFSWVKVSGLSTDQATFWKERGFVEAVKAGRDIVIRHYLDQDGWAWVVVHDQPNQWLARQRLPEAVRNQILRAKQRK